MANTPLFYILSVLRRARIRLLPPLNNSYLKIYNGAHAPKRPNHPAKHTKMAGVISGHFNMFLFCPFAAFASVFLILGGRGRRLVGGGRLGLLFLGEDGGVQHLHIRAGEQLSVEFLQSLLHLLVFDHRRNVAAHFVEGKHTLG